MSVGTDFVCPCAMPRWTLTVGGTPGKNKGSSGSWGVAGLARLELIPWLAVAESTGILRLTMGARQNHGAQRSPSFARAHTQHTL